MAKKRGMSSKGTGDERGAASIPGEERLLDFAEDLGRFLGAAEQKANAWLSQRQEVTKQLTDLRNRTNQLLERLGVGLSSSRAQGLRRTAARDGATDAAAAPGTQARGRSASRKRTRKPMSAEARQKIREAQLRRWAKHRRGQAAKPARS